MASGELMALVVRPKSAAELETTSTPRVSKRGNIKVPEEGHAREGAGENHLIPHPVRSLEWETSFSRKKLEVYHRMPAEREKLLLLCFIPRRRRNRICVEGLCPTPNADL